MPAPVVVFDTNVLLSSIVWRGKPYECLELARRAQVKGLTCREILEELAEKLTKKIGFSTEDVNDALADLLPYLSVVKITGELKAVPTDPDDDKVLECAVVGGASYIVTGDKRHLLPMRNFQGIDIASPADFLLRIAALD